MAVLRYKQPPGLATFIVKYAIFNSDAEARAQAAVDYQVLGRLPQDIINGTNPTAASPTFSTTAAAMTTFLNGLSVQKARQWTSNGAST